MLNLKMGEKAPSFTVGRSTVSESSVGRLLLLDPNPRALAIGFDNILKRSVRCTQQEALGNKMEPRIQYYLLCARLNTDMKGNVTDDTLVVEYVQMAESVYKEFAELYNEMGDFLSIQITKESKGQYSYIKVKPSNSNAVPRTGVIIEKVNALKQNAEFIEAVWEFIEAKTTISFEEWMEARKQKAKENGYDFEPVIVASTAKPKKPVAIESASQQAMVGRVEAKAAATEVKVKTANSVETDDFESFGESFEDAGEFPG